MENLSNSTVADLMNVIKGIQLGYEYNDSIDKQYCLRFKVESLGDKAFKVTYDWYKGVIPGTVGNPQTAKDSQPVVEINYFIINKAESFSKFTKEVMDAISEVTACEFDPEMYEAF